jgi:hypothetical protein
MEPNELQGRRILEVIEGARAHTTDRTSDFLGLVRRAYAPEAPAQTVEVENTEPAVGLTDRMMNARGHRVQRTGLL